MDTSFYPKLLRRESGGWRCVLTGLPCFGVSASLRCRSFHAYYDNAPQHLVHSSKRSAPLQDNPRNIPQNWPNTFNAIPEPKLPTAPQARSASSTNRTYINGGCSKLKRFFPFEPVWHRPPCFWLGQLLVV